MSLVTRCLYRGVAIGAPKLCCLRLFKLTFATFPRSSISISRPRSSNGSHRLRLRSPQRIRQGQRPTSQALPQARSERIHQGGFPYGNWIRRDGIRRVLRQVDLHPN